MKKLTLLACAAANLYAGEYAVLQNGFRIAADYHLVSGSQIHLHTKDGILDLPADRIARFEKEDYIASPPPEPPAPAPVAVAPPTTALFDRMKKEGRLIENSEATSNFSAPNFRTNLPLPVLLRGLSSLLARLYTPEVFFARALRSLELWKPQPTQVPPSMPLAYDLRALLSSIWTQGVRSSYRKSYWKFLSQLVWKWHREPAKLWLGFMILLSAHHFLIYAREVADELEEACTPEPQRPSVTIEQPA